MGVEKLNWADARILMQKANPEFTALLETIDGIEKYEFTKYSYRYGDLICDADYFYDPDGNIVADNIPFGMVVEKSMQFFMELEGYIIPGAVRSIGEMAYISYFSLSDRSALNASWSISSGARNPVIIPTYKQRAKYLQMQIDLGMVHTVDYSSDFTVLRDVAFNINSGWRCEYLGFPVELMEYMKCSSKTWHIREFLLREIMSLGYANNSKNLIQNMILDYIKVHKSNVKNSFYLSSVANHIFDSISGQAMLHKLATSENELPLFDIQKAYEDCYKPKHPPMILVPSNFRENSAEEHFFSIQHHTVMYKPNHIANIVELCVAIRDLMGLYTKCLTEIEIVPNNNLLRFLNSTAISIISDRESAFNETAGVCLFDQLCNIAQPINDQFSNFKKRNESYEFPSRSSFFSGCIMLKKN